VHCTFPEWDFRCVHFLLFSTMKLRLLPPLTLFGLLLLGPAATQAQTQTVRYNFANNLLDQSGNSRHATLVGGASVDATQLTIGSNAADYLAIPPAAMNGLGDFTVLLTVKLDLRRTGAVGNPFHSILSVATPTEEDNDNEFLLVCNPRFNQWRVTVDNTITALAFSAGANSTLDNVWYHVAFVRSGTQAKFYLNGAQIGAAQTCSASPLVVAPGGMLIGQDQDVIGGGFATDQSLAGRVGQLTIYNGALTTEQIALEAQRTWTGDVSTAWANASNWSTFAAPNATNDGYVSSEGVNQPTINAGAVARNLTLGSGSQLLLAAGNTLDLKGNLTNNSFSTDLQGTVSFSGAAAQQLQGTALTGFTNLTVGSAGLTDASAGMSVGRLLTLTGNLTTGATPPVLRSNASGTAMVVNSGGTVSGTVAVQRFIAPGTAPGLGYRHMASPVLLAPLSDLNFSGFTVVTNAAYNSAPNPLSVTPYPNVFVFAEPSSALDFSKGYASPGSPAVIMIPGRGYSVYMPPSTGSATTPDFVGTLNNGPFNAEALTNTGGTANSGWHLLGNPYPAPLDWNLVRAIPGAIPAEMSDAVHVYKSSGANNGTYQSYVNGIGTLAGGLIPVGQGFFVRNTVSGASPVFQFTNAMRATTYANPAHFRPAPDSRPAITLALTNSTDDLTDQAIVYFEEGATAGFDRHFDAGKVGRSLHHAPTLSLLADGQELSISALAPLALATAPALPLRVLTNVAGPHVLRVEALRGLPTGQALWLTDAETGATVDLAAPNASYTFEQAPGFTGARFTLHIGGAKPSAAAASALTLEAVPNPVASTDQLQISLRGLPAAITAAEATLIDALGRTVRRYELAAASGAAARTLPLNGLVAGAYVLRLTVPATGEQVSQKLIVQ
jgi:trimeric autotransporter adhesin